MRSLCSIIGCVLVALWAVGCSESDSTAGIEIGNPEIAQNIGLTADFSIDYSDAKPVSLAKAAAKDEKVVIDTFQLTLTEVRSFCSFYVGVSVNQEDGLLLWPYEDDPAAVLPISFTDGEFVEDAFKNINLQTEGRQFTFLCGHDSNIGSVLAALQAEDYSLPSTIEKKTPIGCKLVIEKWEDGDGKSFAALNLVYQSTEQLRNMTLLDMENPPMVFPVRLKGLDANADGLYSFEDVLKRIDDVIH